MVSYLTAKRIILPFSSFQELAENSKYEFIGLQGSSYLDTFRYSNDPVLKKIWKEKIEPYVDDRVMNLDDRVETLLNNPFAVTFSGSGFLILSQSFVECKIIDTGIVLATDQLAWVTGKQYPFYKTFNYHIKKLFEVGEVQRRSTRYQQEQQVCQD